MSIEIDKKKIPKRDRRIMKFYRKAVDRFRKEIDLCEEAGEKPSRYIKTILKYAQHRFALFYGEYGDVLQYEARVRTAKNEAMVWRAKKKLEEEEKEGEK